MEGKGKSYSGNRWGFLDPVTMSFVCEARFRDRIREAAKEQGKAISELIRDAIEKQLGG